MCWGPKHNTLQHNTLDMPEAPPVVRCYKRNLYRAVVFNVSYNEIFYTMPTWKTNKKDATYEARQALRRVKRREGLGFHANFRWGYWHKVQV